MIQIKKILFPTRFSRRSKWSIAYALQLAKKYKAELHLLHAQVLWDDDPHNPAYHFSDKKELQTRLLNAAKDQMSTDLEKSDIEDIEVKQAFERGMTPSETILKYAAENNIENPKFMHFNDDDSELHFTHDYSEGTETIKVSTWEVMGFIHSQDKK